LVPQRRRVQAAGAQPSAGRDRSPGLQEPALNQFAYQLSLERERSRRP